MGLLLTSLAGKGQEAGKNERSLRVSLDRDRSLCNTIQLLRSPAVVSLHVKIKADTKRGIGPLAFSFYT